MSDTPNPVQVQKHLHGIDYPATKDDLVSSAEREGADDSVLDALRGLPDRSFDGPTAVSEELARGR